MIVHILKEMINESINANEIPFFVNATEGTTVLGSFDTINSIADVCQEYNLWLHVDVIELIINKYVFKKNSFSILTKNRLHGVARLYFPVNILIY